MIDDIRVPREPTDAMMQAGYKEFGASMYSPTANRGWGESAIAIYKAMLLAAQLATPDSAKLVSELRLMAHFADKYFPKAHELLAGAANWIEQHDTQTAQPAAIPKILTNGEAL